MLAVQFFDLVLDRQAVAVPARHIGCVETGQRPGADDDVLEDLVDCVANVNVAVGVGRAIVQNEARASPRRLANPLVEFCLLPGSKPLRFAAGKIATHRKWRVGKIEGFLVIGHGGSHIWKYCFTAATSLAICALRAS
ncbi:MAG: hypothetical protein AW09_000410 [Candidatus Accumulibacter phosphatis]|uniref:Uncharacterized protein n=1 Tax=Candidatus Accumulibacter phosphatis TaxID=327160 RepID=A0A080MAX5_9PROT|nr:MAG: hypothetical protein AW09_000410 [Candidatus Accumulibacter phosphatis]